MADRIGTPLQGPVRIKSTLTPKPIAYSNEIAGGPWNVGTIAQRNAIQTFYRRDDANAPLWGSTCYVHSDPVSANNGRYELVRGLVDNNIDNNDNWQKVSSGTGGSSYTAAQIRDLYESNPDRNAFTDAEKLKLAGISGMTPAQIRDSYESNANRNAYTDAEKAKLSLQSGSNSGDETDQSILGKLLNNPGVNIVTDAEKAIIASTSGTNTGDETPEAVLTKLLSNENVEQYTTAEKDKLAGLENAKWKGSYTNLAGLQSAYPVGEPGWEADVDAGVGDPVQRYIWDESDQQWEAQVGTSTSETAASVKAKYESNPNTNEYSDGDKAKVTALSGINTGDETPASVKSKLLQNPDTNNFGDAEVLKLNGALQGMTAANGISIDNSDPINPKVEFAGNSFLEKNILFDTSDFRFSLEVGNFIRFNAGWQKVSVDIFSDHQFKVDLDSTLIQRLVAGNKAFAEFVESGTNGLFEASLGATEDGTTFKIIANKTGAYLIGTQTDASNAIATQGWVLANAGEGGGGGTGPTKATQAQAETATDDATYMTPLGVLYSIIQRAGIGIEWNEASKRYDLNIVNNLTSDSVDGALSPAQGKALKGLIDKQFYLGYQRETQGNYVTDREYTVELAFHGYKQDVWKILPQTGENALYTISIDSANNDLFQPWSGYVLISGLEGVSDINTFRLPIGWDFQNEYKDVVIPATTQALYKFTRMSAAIYWEFIGDNSEIGGKYPDETTIGTPITTSRSFALTDLGAKKVTAVNSGSAVVLTIPADATLNMPIGSTINLRRRGAGTVQIVGAAGVNIEGIGDTNGDHFIIRFGSVTLYKESANLWVLIGALETT